MADTILDKIQSIESDLEIYSKYYRKKHQESLDIDDLEKAILIQNDAFNKIQKIKEFKSTLTKLSEDIASCGISSEMPNLSNTFEENNVVDNFSEENIISDKLIPDSVIENNLTNNNPDPPIKIGVYVKEFFNRISNEKLSIDPQIFENMQESLWTKETLGVSTPVIKIYNSNRDVSEQIKKNGNARYWKDIFYINSIPCFVSSQWYESQRERFEAWKNSVVFVENTNGANSANHLDEVEKKTNLKASDEFSHTMVDRIIFCNKPYYPTSWAQTLVTVVEILIEKLNLSGYDLSSRTWLRGRKKIYFSDNADNISSPYKLSNGCYLELKFCPADIYRVVYRIIEEFGYSKEDLKIFYSKKEDFKGDANTLHDANECDVEDTDISDIPVEDNNVDIITNNSVTKDLTVNLFEWEYIVDSYGEALFKVCELLMYKQPYVIAILAYKNEFEQYFSSNESKINLPKKLTNGIYVETQLDKEVAMSLIGKIFELCKYNASEINFSITE